MKSGGLLSTGTGRGVGKGIEFAFKRGAADEVGFGSLLDLEAQTIILGTYSFFSLFTQFGEYIENNDLIMEKLTKGRS